MGYHIFMARKIQLTTMKNNAYKEMMNEWIQQTHLGDEEISLMSDKNTALSVEGKSYKSQRDAANEAYDKFCETKRAYNNYQAAAGDAAAQQDIADKYQQKYGQALNTTTAPQDPDDAFKQQFGVDYARYLNNLSDDYKDKKEQIENDYSVDYQILNDQETAIEQAIQVLETHISEYTQEMQKAEQQEATEIKTCIPNYNGAGGGQS